MVAMSRHDAVCLSGSKGPDVGRGGVRWGSPPSPHPCPLCLPHLSSPPPAESLCVGLPCWAWTEDKDQGGRWPFETTHSQYTHPLCPPPSLPLPPVEASVPSTIQYCSRGGGREVAFGSVVSALQGETAAPLPPPLLLLRSATLMILILLLKTLMVFIVSF